MKTPITLLALALAVPVLAQAQDLAPIQTMVQQGRYAEARPLAEAAVKADPQNATARVLLGETMIHGPKPEEAIVPLTAAATADPKSARAFRALGDAQTARFMVALRDWVKEHSNSMLGSVNRDVPTASPEGEGLSGMPGYGNQGSLITEERINDRSSSQMNSKEWEKFEVIARAARDAYGKALELQPADRRALQGKGLTSLILGEWKDTVACFQKAGVPPFDPFIYDVAFNIHDGHAMGEQAIALWQMVVSSEPMNAWAYWNLRNLYDEFHRGDWRFDFYDAMRMLFPNEISFQGDSHKPSVKDGLKALRGLVEKHPDEAMVWRGLGLACALNKDKKGAEEAYKKAADLDPNDWYASYQYGAYRLTAKDAAAAQPALARAAKARPDSALVWHALGSAAEMNKDADSAVIYYERATEAAPQWAEAHLSAGALLLDLRQGAEALPHLEAYVALAPKAKNADEIKDAIRQVKEILAKQGQ